MAKFRARKSLDFNQTALRSFRGINDRFHKSRGINQDLIISCILCVSVNASAVKIKGEGLNRFSRCKRRGNKLNGMPLRHRKPWFRKKFTENGYDILCRIFACKNKEVPTPEMECILMKPEFLGNELTNVDLADYHGARRFWAPARSVFDDLEKKGILVIKRKSLIDSRKGDRKTRGNVYFPGPELKC